MQEMVPEAFKGLVWGIIAASFVLGALYNIFGFMVAHLIIIIPIAIIAVALIGLWVFMEKKANEPFKGNEATITHTGDKK